MRCIFCANALSIQSGFYVCNDCHTVCFSKSSALENKYSLILKYLSDIQKKVIDQQAYLHDVEQKHISGYALTDEEEIIRKNMIEFQDIRLELNTRIAGCSQLNDKTERNLLYRLLILSEWFSEYFKEEVQ